MIIEDALVDAGHPEGREIPREHTVVAVVIERHGKIALFRRSPHLDHDSSLWHCITGFVEHGASPRQQAIDELFEETGLEVNHILALRSGPDLVIDDASERPWLIHTFTAVIEQRRLRINWEHDSYRWTKGSKATRFANRVSWLDQVLDATGHFGRRPNAVTGVRTLSHGG